MLKILDKKKLQALIKNKYISERKHPKLDLYIYNYTAKCVYDSNWNEYTRACRGLIADKKGNIVQRPFEKFFNYEEHSNSKFPNVPTDQSFIIQDKMDGSMGILCWEGNKPALATRGSFVSEQAKVGTEILRTKYKDVKFNKKYTYLFEIVYKENRIVVDYKNEKDIFLLAIIETKSGKQYTPERFIQGMASSLNYKKLRTVEQITNIGESNTTTGQILELQKRNINNKEGYVFWFMPSNFRIKIKFEEYFRLHRLITGINTKSIWDLLKHGQSFDELLDRVPNEFYNWVKKIKRDLEKEYLFLYEKSIEVCKWIKKNTKTRKEFAEKAKEAKRITSLIFKVYDEDYEGLDEMIWKMLKPVYSKPFTEEL